MPPHPSNGFAEIGHNRRPTGLAGPGEPIVDRENGQSLLGQPDNDVGWVGSPSGRRAADPAAAVNHQDSGTPADARQAVIGMRRSGKVNVKCRSTARACGKAIHVLGSAKCPYLSSPAALSPVPQTMTKGSMTTHQTTQ